MITKTRLVFCGAHAKELEYNISKSDSAKVNE